MESLDPGLSSDLLVVARAAGVDYREVAMREHTYSEAELRGFEQAQLRFEESWQRQFGVPYGCVPPEGFRVRRTGRAAAALRVPCAVAWWCVRIACIVVAVPFFVLFAVCVVAAMFAPFRL